MTSLVFETGKECLKFQLDLQNCLKMVHSSKFMREEECNPIGNVRPLNEMKTVMHYISHI